MTTTTKSQARTAPAKVEVEKVESNLPTFDTSNTRKCACGCGDTTTRIFAPGHDARYVSQLVKKHVVSGEQATRANFPTDALYQKYVGALANANARLAEKMEREEAKAKAAKAKASSAA